jgi:hypothetical protein
LASAEVPGSKGLFDPEKEGKLLVSFALGRVETVPLREEGKVKSWKVRQVVHPTFVQRVDADTDEVEARFELLLDGDPRAAGALLDKLKARAERVLATA